MKIYLLLCLFVAGRSAETYNLPSLDDKVATDDVLSANQADLPTIVTKPLIIGLDPASIPHIVPEDTTRGYAETTKQRPPGEQVGDFAIQYKP